jgi:hypothetical protein
LDLPSLATQPRRGDRRPGRRPRAALGEPPSFAAARAGSNAVETLEAGGIVCLPIVAFELTPAERRLLNPDLCDPRSKSVSFDPSTGVVRGSALAADELAPVAALMARYAAWAESLLQDLAPAYGGALRRGRTSLRPRSVDEPALSRRRDDRLLHVDAFPSQPTGGQRVLRVFSNINPDGQPRVWQVGEPFEDFARRWLPRARRPWPGEAWLLQRLRVTRGRRTPYDFLMLALHDSAKLNDEYQRSAPRQDFVFPSNSSWIVFSDAVVHAAVAGRHALEQTFYLPVEAMADEARSPLRTLERLTGRRLC